MLRRPFPCRQPRLHTERVDGAGAALGLPLEWGSQLLGSTAPAQWGARSLAPGPGAGGCLGAPGPSCGLWGVNGAELGDTKGGGVFRASHAPQLCGMFLPGARDSRVPPWAGDLCTIGLRRSLAARPIEPWLWHGGSRLKLHPAGGGGRAISLLIRKGCFHQPGTRGRPVLVSHHPTGPVWWPWTPRALSAPPWL